MTAGAVPVPAAHGLWFYVWKLLRLRAVIFISGLSRASRGRKLGYALLALAVIALVVFAFWISANLLGFLRSPELARQLDLGVFLASVPSLVLGIAFTLILFTSFGVLLQALYLSGDMDFLLSAPLPMRAVFVSKLLEAILPSLAIFAVLGLPVLFGLGASGGYNILYYPLTVVVLVALALAAAGLSSLLVMTVVRVFPARRVAEVLGFIGAIVAVVMSQAGNFTRSADVSGEQTAALLNTLARLNTPWSPLAWGGLGLIGLGEGRWLTAALYLMLTLGVSAAIFAVALNTAERWYYSGWAALQGMAIKRRPARARAVRTAAAAGPGPLAFVTRRIPPAVRAVAVKDFLVIRRDLRNMSQLITPLIIGVMYAVLLIGSGGEAPAGRGEAPPAFMQAMRNMLVYADVGLALFVSWSMLSRLALTGFSQEGRSYWLLKTAPVTPGKLLASKFLVAYLPTLALAWIFLVIISVVRSAGVSALLYGLAVVTLCLAGAAGVTLALGVMGAKLDWVNPQQMIRATSGCASELARMAYLGASLALFFGIPIVIALLGGPEAIGQIIGLVLGGGVSLACAIVPPRMVADRVQRLGEA